MSAAIRVIASHGLSAPTAMIAKEAGISNGSLFTYFETKDDLFNHLFMELKADMATAALAGLPAERDIRAQMFHLWSNWLRWATSCPDKRRTLAQLDVSDEITPTSRQVANQAMAAIAQLLEQSRENGPMRDVPLALVAVLMGALADATIDFMIRNPANADEHGISGFDALWRIVS